MKGVIADGPMHPDFMIDTWHAEVDASASVAMSDMVCVANPTNSQVPAPYNQPFIDDLEFVER